MIIVKNVVVILAGEKNLYTKNTVKENIFYLSVLRGMRNSEINKMIKKYIEYFPLYNDIKDKVVESLSYGQKRLTAIFSALVSGAEYIFMDEITEGLDANHIELISKLVKKISMEKTIIIVSHDYNFVANISDKILFLKDAKFVFETDKINAENLKNRYRDIYQVEVS